MKKIKYKGKDRRKRITVFSCLEIHQRDVGEFFGGLFRAIEEEKQKLLKEMKEE